MIDQVSALDEMRKFFVDGLAVAAVPAGLTAMPPVRWQGKIDADLPPDFYFYFSTKIVKSPQSAHMTDANGGSKAIFDTSGLIGITVFAAMAAADSGYIASLLAKLARDIFRRGETNGGVWFRNAVATPLENDGQHFRYLVTVAFEFSEI